MVEKGSRAEKAERTKRALLEAAKRCIGLEGYTGASISKISQAAGVSKSVVYYHFRSKEEIATAVLEDAFGTIFSQCSNAIAGAKDAPAALRDMLSAFADFLFGNKELSRFLLSELWRGERAWSEVMSAKTDVLTAMLEDQVKRGVKEGVIRSDVDARFAAVSMLGIILAASQYCLSRGEQGGKEQFVAQVLGFVAPALER